MSAHTHKPRPNPPRWAQTLLSWWGHPDTREEVQGDLLELYQHWVRTQGRCRANWRYSLNALHLLRPLAKPTNVPDDYLPPFFLNPAMLRNYLKIACRNLVNNKVYSLINIGGLAVGMAVAMLIGLWMWDELSFNKSHKNYERIAQVMQHQSFNGEIATQGALPFPIGAEIRNTYGNLFTYVVMGDWINSHILSTGDRKFKKLGAYMEPQTPDLLTLTMLRGSRAGLREMNSILLSESVATAYFGTVDPVGKLMKIDNKFDVKVTGVYKDIDHSSTFSELSFIAPWDLYINSETWPEKRTNPWRSNSYVAYAQIAGKADMAQVSAAIKNVKLNNVHKDEAVFKPEVFLHPMAKWHLHSDWKNGVQAGGRIQYVWLFGIIGVFVLLLACINFMNLSTARSEKRAKEVGIRKAVGSVRGQLIGQFFSESLLVVFIAFCLSVGLVQLLLPTFNRIADKQLAVLWQSPLFWLLGLGFSILTGLIAGSYPAFYLSSFQPVNVLKGTFKAGRFATLPRKILVVIQFTVSVTLIIGTIIVFRQIQFARNRPVGYSKEGLISVPMYTAELTGHYDAIRAELLKTGAVAEVAQSSSPTTGIWAVNNGYEWRGKSPNVQGNFATVAVSHDFGKTVGWQFSAGRDFSRDFASDSSGIVLNEAAVKFMGLKNRKGETPVGETMRVDGKPYKIIGIIKNMVMDSPYNPAFRTVFMVDYNWANLFTVRIAPATNASNALPKIESVFRKYAPAAPFDYRFVDQEYARKFGDEERIGNLASIFAGLAIFISCLGLFGLASFMAEQRTKEIGVRKVLGASVLNLWGLLSKDFVVLVLIAFFVATPIAYYSLSNWLLKYEYRTDISWWIFAASGAGALIVTLLTVSFQSIKAALMNPVKSLRSE